ncbi:uncharacterized protein MELLADRAFT_93449 [Melampsora larici-populina 98AG31]|uniref:Uncharacterized protein n=1 Tax=Melampsora larici-populina (strain 98AG31 / pathotype 3-4-7) TaxID=747676 RepID=F4RAE6_MELLP|nr:uncharacterized protein MELLADRAFT_93449 [Melampsora larici-populina 98AG31]EGG10795.1 hypothetical protein MELLADRAFT_93449 [Melampsora larici-populina 98AG31]
MIKSKLFNNHNHNHQQPHQNQDQHQPHQLHPQHRDSSQVESDQFHDFMFVHQTGSSDSHSISNLSFNRVSLSQQQSPPPPPLPMNHQNSHYSKSKVNIPRLKANNSRTSLPGLPSQARSPTTITTTGPKILKLDHHILPLSSPSLTNLTHLNTILSPSAKPSTSANSQTDQVLQITNNKLPSPHGSTFIRSTPSLPKVVHLPPSSLEPRPFTQQSRPSRPYPALPTFISPNAIKITPISSTTTSEPNSALDTVTTASEPLIAVHAIAATPVVESITDNSNTITAVDTTIPVSDTQTTVDTIISISDTNTALDPSTVTCDINTAQIDGCQSIESSPTPVSLPVSSPATLNETISSSIVASSSPSILAQPKSPPQSHPIQLASPFGSTIPKSRHDSADLAEARKIILGLQLQVDGLKQQQQLPPSPALSNPPTSHLKKRFSGVLLPTRPISPDDGSTTSKRHSVDAAVNASFSPKSDSDTSSLPEIQASLCALLSPNLQSSITRSSRAGSSPNVMSPKLCASTSTQSSLVTTSAKSLTNSTRSLTGLRTRSRDASLSGRHDLSYVRDRNMSSARHELIERLSIASSRSGITLSEFEVEKQENVDEAFKPAHHRSQPSHASQASIERFGTPESSPPWACSNDSFPEPPGRPPLATRPQPQLRSKAGRHWQQVGDSQSAARAHTAQRSISSFSTSSAAHRTLSPRRPSSPPTLSRGTLPFGSNHHDRKNSMYSSLGSPLTAVPSQQPSIHSLFSPESQQPRQKHGSWVTDVPSSSASRSKFRPPVSGRGLLPSASYNRQDTSASAVSSLDQRPSSVQSSYVDANAPSPSLSSTATTISTSISLPSLAEVRTMSKLDVYLIASKLASELDSATRRFGIEKQALLDALTESREMCDQLRQLCESELNSPEQEFKSDSRGGEEVLRERVEMLEVENSRLEIRANAMANELKRAVVDLRVAGEKTGSVLKASRIPRRSGSLARSGSKLSLQSENQWRADDSTEQNNYEEVSSQFAELERYRFQPSEGNGMDEVAEEENEEEEEEMHLSDHGMQLEENENGRAGSPASTILASRTGDEDEEEDDWINSVHNRISLGTLSGESNIGWRLRPEDELFLQDLDEDEFDGVAADMARGNDEDNLFTLS